MTDESKETFDKLKQQPRVRGRRFPRTVWIASAALRPAARRKRPSINPYVGGTPKSEREASHPQNYLRAPKTHLTPLPFYISFRATLNPQSLSGGGLTPARHYISRECYSDQVQSDGLDACLWPVASFEDFCCPGTAEPPSLDGAALGSAESRDHCGRGFSWEIPGAEEDFLWTEGGFDGTGWWNGEELDEGAEEPESGSSGSFAVAEIDFLSLSSGAGEAVQDTSQSSFARETPSLKNRVSEMEHSCEYPNCGQSFSHRYKLNKHRKYHSKSYCCLEKSCLARKVAFSREQDLIRHQSQHNGRRFYCSHADCVSAIDGAKNGFTRKDNLKRHLDKQHQQTRQ
ncbi:Zinc finger transcription factor ace1 protein [Rutstroemia sp. NJR-2017a BVV2]|nr:Zinc finger transcription factor ace1 protein [Rutstroemia sp. NJR-2017a BVV2]